MSTSLFLDCPSSTSLSKPKKKWRSAFVTIYCSRAFLSFLKPGQATDTVTNSPDHCTVTVVSGPDINGFEIDQTSLSNLVKDRNINKLQTLGGVGEIATALKTDTNLGIVGDAVDITKRTESFGSNKYDRAPIDGFLRCVQKEALKNFPIQILVGFGALALGIGVKMHGFKQGWITGGTIFLAIIIAINIPAITRYSKKRRQFDNEAEVISNVQVEAMRNGRHQQISIFEVVVGEVICLKIGDHVPADGLLLDGHSLSVDESSMTGSSLCEEVSVHENPFLWSGTKINDGFGRMLVTAVGMNTYWGEMMSSITYTTCIKTAAEEYLDKTTSTIGKVGLAIAFLVPLVLLVQYFSGNTDDENGVKEFKGSQTSAYDTINSVIAIAVAAISIFVVAVPEGLSLAVTLTLTYSMKRMMADKAMVRNLSACETMRSVTTICTDKTATLTMTQMKVTEFWLGIHSVGDEEAYASISTDVLNLMQEGVVLNTSIRPNSDSDIEISGNPTEKAILSWAVHDLKTDVQKVVVSCRILRFEAFNSIKKRSRVSLKRTNSSYNTTQVHWKGAAEEILAMCTSYYDIFGHVNVIDRRAKIKFEYIMRDMAANGLRCMAFAYKEGPAEHISFPEEEGLILLGLIGLECPCRPGVKKAVEDCQNARVNIKMITGDDKTTAIAMAKESGILRPGQVISNGAVIEGAEFLNYTYEERLEKVEEICVMARSNPYVKLLMVQCLKQKGHVVAVTGDGADDAPALKEADIGFSMGIQGTEVAKESSDIVIMDNSFVSLVRVLLREKCVYLNIQKLIQFQLTVNIVGLLINFVATISAGGVPYTAVRSLWVNLIMDTLGALALSSEKPTKDIMDKPPVGRRKPLITNIMWRNLLLHALYQIIVLMIIQFRGKHIFGVDGKVKDTMVFNTFQLCQIFNVFNARNPEKMNIFSGLRNNFFLRIVAVTILLQVVIVEFLNKFADTVKLDLGQWGVCLGIAALSWPIDWVVKYTPVPDRPIFSYLKKPHILDCILNKMTQMSEVLLVSLLVSLLDWVVRLLGWAAGPKMMTADVAAVQKLLHSAGLRFDAAAVQTLLDSEGPWMMNDVRVDPSPVQRLLDSAGPKTMTAFRSDAAAIHELLVLAGLSPSTAAVERLLDSADPETMTAL